MQKQSIQTVVDFIEKNSRREVYWGNKEDLSSIAYGYDKAVIKELGGRKDAFQLLRRFVWLMSMAENPSDDVVQEKYLKAMSLFGLCEIGIPDSETSALVEAVLNLFSKYANSETKDITALSEFKMAEEVFSDLRAKFRNDPRFKKKFDDVTWGWS